MFSQIQKQVQAQFNKITANGGTLFQVEIDKDKIWETYLGAFPEELRQGNNCNCCKSFLRQYAGIVGLINNQKVTLWDFVAEDGEYADAVKALHQYVVRQPITGIFLNSFAKCGSEKTPDPKKQVIWNHFFITVPAAFVKPVVSIGPAQSTALSSKDVFKRSLEEITTDSVDTVLELIGQNSLYRGNEFKGMLTEFRQAQTRFKAVKGADPKDNFCWTESVKTNGAVARIRNTSIGTLLNDLSGGRDLDSAVGAFERVVAPSNYKRPTALVTPKMVENAKARLQELNLIGSLNRRLLSDRDLTVANALFVHRSTESGGDIFDQLKKDTTVNPKTLAKVEEISIADFVSKVLPSSKSIRVLVENRHMGNFVSLIGPQNEEDNSLFKWNNNYSWAYSGGVADSIKEKVKTAGGKVDGVLRISLAWHNHDDLDLHVIEPGGHEIHFRNKGRTSPTGGVLDVDMNAGGGTTREPVENITWASQPKREGEYTAFVRNFARRETDGTGFEVEAEYDGETYNFSSKSNGATGKDNVAFKFTYSQKEGVKFIGATAGAGYNSREKWGVKTGQFHKVKALTLSPNFWNSEIGNKHYLFLLDGCKTDEDMRPFLNEQLKQELDADRKVFEILGGKMKVEPVENELSGLGFSDTIKTHLFIEVEGAFRRTLKVNF